MEQNHHSEGGVIMLAASRTLNISSYFDEEQETNPPSELVWAKQDKKLGTTLNMFRIA